MKKKFYLDTHFAGSFELKSKPYRKLSNISEAELLILKLIKKGYEVNVEECYANFNELQEVPLNQSKSIAEKDELKSIVIKGKELEIMIENKDSVQKGVFGCPFSQGIAGYISLKNAKTKEELDNVEKIIEENWHIEDKENKIVYIKYKKRRKLNDIINLRRGYQF